MQFSLHLRAARGQIVSDVIFEMIIAVVELFRTIISSDIFRKIDGRGVSIDTGPCKTKRPLSGYFVRITQHLDDIPKADLCRQQALFRELPELRHLEML